MGEIGDIVSFNYYPAWYHGYGNLSFASSYWKGQAQGAHGKWPDKPFLISETGGGGIWEYQNTTDCKWSQLYQSEVVMEDVETALNDSLVSGLLFCFCLGVVMKVHIRS